MYFRLVSVVRKMRERMKQREEKKSRGEGTNRKDTL